MTRKTTIIITGIIILGGFLISKVLSDQKKTLVREEVVKKQQVFKTIQINTDDLQTEIETSGRLGALNKVEIYAEVSGILQNTPKRFKAGNYFSKNEFLVRIDDSVYKNNLLAQKSSLLNQITLMLPDLGIDFPGEAEKWELYLAAFDLNKPINALPMVNSDQEKYYIASRNIFNQYYTVKSMEATLSKYNISAPFDGVVIASEINPGTLVRVGQKLGEFMNTDNYELEVSVGINEVDHLKKGTDVLITSDDLPGTFKGVVSRINQSIDPATQTLQVFIQTNESQLKDGMFLTAHIKTGAVPGAVLIKRELIVNKNQVYVVIDSVLTLQTVDIVNDVNNMVLVRGLADGTHILAEKSGNLYDGMKIN